MYQSYRNYIKASKIQMKTQDFTTSLSEQEKQTVSNILGCLSQKELEKVQKALDAIRKTEVLNELLGNIVNDQRGGHGDLFSKEQKLEYGTMLLHKGELIDLMGRDNKEGFWLGLGGPFW